MRINFFLRFHTQFGQSFFISGNIGALGKYDQNLLLPMNYLNNEFWQATIEVNPLEEPVLNYHYVFRTEKGELVMDAEKKRTIKLHKTEVQSISIIDAWNYAGEYENVFSTAPFTQVLLEAEKQGKVKAPDVYTHIFKVKTSPLADDECVCLLGNEPGLNEWNEKEPVLLQKGKEWWVAKIDLSTAHFPLAYKYGIYNKKENSLVRYEEGPNRILYFSHALLSKTILHDGFMRLPGNTWKGAGVAIPVFSLKSKESFGIGEFTDITLLADWAKEAGLKLIQLLPINDTTATFTWRDSYPYAAISAFALHPIYINLHKVAGKKSGRLLEAFHKKKKALNELPSIDYEKVLNTKLNILRDLYEDQQDEFLHREDFKSFFEANTYWLVSYAAFCYLRDQYNTSQFGEWKTHSVYRKEEINQLCSPNSGEFRQVAFWYFVQYHLHLQLKEAVLHAHSMGIVIKGDIPIGIYRYGCDAWAAPQLYNMNYQAGAPPDDFSTKGQNWNFPTYNWQQMQADGFAWWAYRFHQMSHYFDAFRIDHILGFFRIWSVPVDAVEGIMGIFVPALPLQIHEFSGRGIPFDYERFCKPFITDEIVHELFAEHAGYVRHTFLQWNDKGRYELKEPFNTQRKVEAYFDTLEDKPENKKIKSGLFDLISNVILLEEPGSDRQMFHFRISMDRTTSYRYLDNGFKHRLYEFYIHYFYHRHDEFWRKEALNKLPQLKAATNMLVCGEDLGMVPHCVPSVMKDLGILSLEIQRMPKNPHTEFFHPKDAPYLSVVTPSTHDMTTIRGWWEENRLKTQRFYRNILLEEGPAPYFCDAWVNKRIVLQHLHAPAMWAIFQLQDLLGMSEKLRRDNPREERINEPANPQHYWRYRIHVYLEDLIQEKEFSRELNEYFQKSGR